MFCIQKTTKKFNVGAFIFSKNENKLSIKQIIDAKDRISAGRTLSAKALYFLGPTYKDVYNIPKPTKNLLEKFRS